MEQKSKNSKIQKWNNKALSTFKQTKGKYTTTKAQKIF